VLLRATNRLQRTGGKITDGVLEDGACSSRLSSAEHSLGKAGELAVVTYNN